jgi:hypothetical protein
VSPNITITNLPEEVLLEIFDSYRKILHGERNYERVWNGNEGWLKLAHVCQRWRQVVLTSPARLHMRLLFTEHTTRYQDSIRHLPLLPFVLDHRYGWGFKGHCITSALENPGRVCGIALTIPDMMWNTNRDELLAYMNQHFPELESLEFDCLGTVEPRLRNSPPFLATEPPHLRRLKYTGEISRFTSQVLLRTRSLVELTLCLDTDRFSLLRTLLLAPLQDLSLLRFLNLEIGDSSSEPPDSTKDFLLPQLTCLSFTGHVTQLEALMACLVAPSLQELRISLPEPRPAFPNTTYFPRFIRNLERSFLFAQLNTSDEGINLVMPSSPISTRDTPFRIVASPMVSIQQIGSVFSSILATVQDVFIASPFRPKTVPHTRGLPPWRQFLKLFHNAKMLRISCCIEPEIGAILRPNNGTSASQLLPALEEIELNAGTPKRIDESQLVSLLDLFKPFVDARQKARRPLRVHWNTDRVLPVHFCDADV